MILCDECNCKVEEEAIFCANCGNQVNNDRELRAILDIVKIWRRENL